MKHFISLRPFHMLSRNRKQNQNLYPNQNHLPIQVSLKFNEFYFCGILMTTMLNDCLEPRRRHRSHSGCLSCRRSVNYAPPPPPQPPCGNGCSSCNNYSSNCNGDCGCAKCNGNYQMNLSNPFNEMITKLFTLEIHIYYFKWPK